MGTDELKNLLFRVADSQDASDIDWLYDSDFRRILVFSCNS